MNESNETPGGTRPSAGDGEQAQRELTADEKSRLSQVQNACRILNDAVNEHLAHVPRFNLQQVVMQELDGMGKILYGIDPNDVADIQTAEQQTGDSNVGEANIKRQADEANIEAVKTGSEWNMMLPNAGGDLVPQRVRVEGVDREELIVHVLIVGTETRERFELGTFLSSAVLAV